MNGDQATRVRLGAFQITALAGIPPRITLIFPPFRSGVEMNCNSVPTTATVGSFDSQLRSAYPSPSCVQLSVI